MLNPFTGHVSASCKWVPNVPEMFIQRLHFFQLLCKQHTFPVSLIYLTDQGFPHRYASHDTTMFLKGIMAMEFRSLAIYQIFSTDWLLTSRIQSQAGASKKVKNCSSTPTATQPHRVAPFPCILPSPSDPSASPRATQVPVPPAGLSEQFHFLCTSSMTSPRSLHPSSPPGSINTLVPRGGPMNSFLKQQGPVN